MEEKKECCCHHKTKERSDKEYKDLINRLSRIEGQVRGIKKMVENDTYCTDILVQVSAVNAALNSFNKWNVMYLIEAFTIPAFTNAFNR